LLVGCLVQVAGRDVFGADFAGVRKASLFFDRKCVQFGAEHNGWAAAVLEDGNNPGAADIFSDLVAESAEPARQFRRRLRFMKREFRILMQIQIEA
jgi:hypothetical protein